MTLDQQQINEVEWLNPDNWAGPARGLEVYFSKRDTRVWVPKRPRHLGWTINLGHRLGVIWLMGIILLPILILSVTWLVVDVLG